MNELQQIVVILCLGMLLLSVEARCQQTDELCASKISDLPIGSGVAILSEFGGTCEGMGDPDYGNSEIKFNDEKWWYEADSITIQSLSCAYQLMAKRFQRGDYDMTISFDLKDVHEHVVPFIESTGDYFKEFVHLKPLKSRITQKAVNIESLSDWQKGLAIGRLLMEHFHSEVGEAEFEQGLKPLVKGNVFEKVRMTQSASIGELLYTLTPLYEAANPESHLIINAVMVGILIQHGNYIGQVNVAVDGKSLAVGSFEQLCEFSGFTLLLFWYIEESLDSKALTASSNPLLQDLRGFMAIYDGDLDDYRY